MVVIYDTAKIHSTVENLYRQVGRLYPLLVQGVDLEGFYKSIAFGTGPVFGLKAKLLTEGQDSGKLTLEEKTDGTWKPLSGIEPVPYVASSTAAELF